MTTLTGRVAVGLVAACASVALAADTAPPPRPVYCTPAEDRAKAYRALFEKVGRAGLADLAKDKDTSLALQASWEIHKKLVERATKHEFYPDDTYDPTEVKKFLDFLKDRTKAPIPEWWAKAISDLSVKKGEFHLYGGIDPKRSELNEIKTGNLVRRVRKGVTLTQGAEMYTYKSGDVSFEVPESKGPGDLLAGDCLADVNGEKITCLGAYSSAFARRFQIAGFENKGGKRIWDTKVWALAKPLHAGTSAGHRVEMTTNGDTVFVFGVEMWGTYAEGFELTTGKCQFRFCTSYWGAFSETWDLK